MKPPPLPGVRRGPGGSFKRPLNPRKQRNKVLGEKGGKGKGDGGGKGKDPRPSTWKSLAFVASGFLSLVGYGLYQWFKDEKLAKDRSRSVSERLLKRPLVMSEHAACRMDCRFVGRDEVNRAMESGRFLPRQSRLGAVPCPRLAMEDGRVRAVFAACQKETVLVTVMDTVTNHPCGPC